MVARVAEVIAELKANPPPLPEAEIAEAIQFLEWLVDNNFTFLGIRDYRLTGEDALAPVIRDRPGHSALAEMRCCGAATAARRSRRRSAPS